jgi:hypothetical protein
MKDEDEKPTVDLIHPSSFLVAGYRTPKVKLVPV